MWHPHHQQHRHTSHASPSSSSSSTSTSSPHQHQQQQQQLQEQQQQLYQQQQHSPFASNSNGIGNSASRRCAPQSPPHARRPLLRFPPPPAYPPPVGVVAESAAAALAAGAHQQYWRAATLAQCADNVGAVNTSVAAVAAHRPTRHSSTGRAAVTPSDMQSSTSPEPWADSESVVRFDPNDYSYAYYEPGPATRHVNVPAPPLQRKCSSPMSSSSTTSTPGTSRARTLDSMPGTSSEPHPRSICSRPSRHTYMTRYGTQENIYEEITDMARYGSSPPAHHVHHGRLRSQHEQSLISLSQSLVEEEVRRVQSRHRRILGELNLSVEAMLMPSPSSNEGSDEADRDGEHDDQLADLLNVGPTDELLSPASCNPTIDLDSGFSGSSSGASYQSAVGSLRRGPHTKPRSSSTSFARSSTPVASTSTSSAGGCSFPLLAPPTMSLRNSHRGAVNGAMMMDSGAGFSGCAGASVSAPGSCVVSASGTGNSSSNSGAGNKSFWSRKGWRKLAGFGSNNNNNKSMTFDEPRLRSGSWDEAASAGGGTVQHTVQVHASAGGGGGGGAGRRLDHTPSQRTVSSEESWCSGSDPDVSSDDESDRSIASSTKSNGHLRNTLNKARSIWRSSGGAGSGRLSMDGALPGETSPGGVNSSLAAQGRLSRWFSIRRGSTHQYEIGGADTTDAPPTNTNSRPNSGANCTGNKMPLLPEVEEESVTSFPNCLFQQRRQVPPSLPPPPTNLTPQQLKRRMIVAAIVHSENNYVATLQRLVNDYKKPLEESNPPILSQSKIATLFHRLPEILQCHTLFRIALSESIRNWDRDERIGDVFIASFSKAIVLDIYSGFINNFSVAMDLAKMEAKRKSALADFLKVKQISSHDRLSFFGLMVKPVQRFPQFILFLQDLLKHTPQGHHDRMSLQLALTQLESLAEMLNERKRETEQFQAFKEMLRHISGKFSARPLSDNSRYLLREDNVTQLEFNQNGMITKTKPRRLLLLNDLVVCVSVAPKASDDFGASERLSLKWTYPVTEIEVQDTSTSPTLSRILTAGINRGGSLKSNGSGTSENTNGLPGSGADNLCAEMNNLMHDYEVMSRITDLVSTLKGSYNGFTVESTRRVLNKIQTSIQRKDEEMAWVDSCCLQLVAKTKNGKEEVYTFQTDNPSIKKEWITELRLAQLALDPCNSPAWEVPEQEQRPSTKMPLFVRAQPVYKSQHQTEVRCGCFYTVNLPKPTRRKGRTQNYLWVCTTDGASSHITILQQHQQQAGILRDVGAFDLVETQVTAMEFVRGASSQSPGSSSQSTDTSGDTVWMGTDSRKLILYTAAEPEKQEECANTTVPALITQIKYHCESVFVALGNGSILIYRKNATDGIWLLKEPQSLTLGSDPVSSLLPINLSMYAACGKKVWVMNGITGEIQKNFSVQHEHVGNVNLMAHSGIGLWISLKNSSTICLYHTETFKHLQDINIASNVMRIASRPDSLNNCSSRECVNNGRSPVYVTALMACKGLLWVGTNVGISLTIPLPRLEGVPIISGRVNISYHAHFGPISFLLALHPTKTATVVSNSSTKDTIQEHEQEEVKEKKDSSISESGDTKDDKQKLEKQLSDSSVTSITANKLRHHLTSSPVNLRRRRSKDNDIVRLSKTLPRGLGCGAAMFSTSTTSSQGSGDTCDVYGLYGELMYIKDYDGEDGALTDPVYESLRRSDPELAAIPGKVSTLDRRLRMKVSRPRSLDLSNWSVDSRSSSLYTSSGSEESMAIRNGVGRSVSRNNSNASRTIQMTNGASEVTSVTVEAPATTVQKQSSSAKAVPKTLPPTTDVSRRTVITLMGGRGYVNWRTQCCGSDKTKNSFSIKEPNGNDAHVVIWEMKL